MSQDELSPTTVQTKKIDELISGIRQLDLRWQTAKDDFAKAMKEGLQKVWFLFCTVTL